MASAGSLFGLALAMRLAETHGDVLVVASEKMSAVIERATDPNTAILFGDGAGAALVSVAAGPVAHAGRGAAHRRPVSRRPGVRWERTAAHERIDRDPASCAQDPRVDRGSAGAPEYFRLSRCAVFLLHQANLNLLTRVAKALGVGPEKIFTNVQRYGNTSSASMLIAASEWAETNPAQIADRSCFPRSARDFTGALGGRIGSPIRNPEALRSRPPGSPRAAAIRTSRHRSTSRPGTNSSCCLPGCRRC